MTLQEVQALAAQQLQAQQAQAAAAQAQTQTQTQTQAQAQPVQPQVAQVAPQPTLAEGQQALQDMQTPDATELAQAQAAPAQVVPTQGPVNVPVDATGAPRRRSIEEVIPGLGQRPLDPQQAIARVDKADEAYNRDSAQAVNEQKEGAKLALQAETKDNDAKAEDAKAQLAQNQIYQHQLVENQAKQEEIQHRVEASIDEDIGAHKALYMKDPTRWWANNNNGAKASAILSIIGTGLQGKDPTHLLNDLIAKDTAELSRQEGNLDKIGALTSRKGGVEMAGAKMRMANLDARQLAAMDILKSQLQSRLSTSANMHTQANYSAAIGKLDEDIAQKRSVVAHNRAQEAAQFGGQEGNQDNMRMQFEVKEDAAEAARRAKGQSGPARPIAGWKGPGLYSSQLQAGQKYLTARSNIIQETDKVIDYLDHMPRDMTGKAATLQDVQMVQRVLFNLQRTQAEAGARLEGKESENITGQNGTIPMWLAGKATGETLQNQLRLHQALMADQAQTFMNNGTPGNNEADPSSTFGKVLARNKDFEYKKSAEDQLVARIMRAPISEAEKKKRLTDQATVGNRAAASALADLETKNSRLGNLLDSRPPQNIPKYTGGY